MSVNKVNKTTGDLSLLAGGTLYADNPIGSIIPYGGATAPAGWFICDGTELVRSTYPELFAVIGTSFGTPSDNTKFKLPDLREATTKGIGLTGKSNNHMDADGLALGEFIDDRLQSHKHNVAFKAVKIFGAGANWGAEYDDSDTPTSTIEPQTGRYGDTTEVKAVGVNYIIKAVSVGVPADFMSAVDKAVDEAISDIDTDYIKVKHYLISDITHLVGNDLTSRTTAVLDSGYKFLAYISVNSEGWVTPNPIYTAMPWDISGSLWTSSDNPVPSGYSLAVTFLEIKE